MTFFPLFPGVSAACRGLSACGFSAFPVWFVIFFCLPALRSCAVAADGTIKEKQRLARTIMTQRVFFICPHQDQCRYAKRGGKRQWRHASLQPPSCRHSEYVKKIRKDSGPWMGYFVCSQCDRQESNYDDHQESRPSDHSNCNR